MSHQHSIDISEQAGVRHLHFGSDWVQGAMRIARPWSLELDYTRDMMAGLLLREPAQWPRSALVVGLGAASLVRFIYRHLPHCQMTAVEINPDVVAAARHFFKLPDDDQRLKVVVGDGAKFLAATHDTYDLILVDGFDADARSGQLESQAFYADCQRSLSTDGLLSCNFLGQELGFPASIQRPKNTFQHHILTLPPCRDGNVVAIAAPGQDIAIDLATLHDRALIVKNTTGLNLLPTIKRLQG